MAPYKMVLEHGPGIGLGALIVRLRGSGRHDAVYPWFSVAEAVFFGMPNCRLPTIQSYSKRAKANRIRLGLNDLK